MTIKQRVAVLLKRTDSDSSLAFFQVINPTAFVVNNIKNNLYNNIVLKYWMQTYSNFPVSDYDKQRIRGFSTTMRYINRHYLSIYLSII